MPRPKNKFIHITKDDSFSSDQHYLSNMPAMAEAACSYDLDQVDDSWLIVLNGERAMMGLSTVTEEQFERVIEELEVNIHLEICDAAPPPGEVESTFEFYLFF